MFRPSPPPFEKSLASTAPEPILAHPADFLVTMNPLPPKASAAVLSGLKRIDTATIADAIGRFTKRPEEGYTDVRLRHMLPELGSFIGYAVTLEVTTNDTDSPALSFYDHYRHMQSLKRPIIAVFKDVDSNPGRGASFGEGMSVLHRKCGGVGMIVDGTIRDLAGLKQRRFPCMAWGAVPGHGRYKPVRFNAPVTVCGMRIRPNDLLQCDVNGCVRIPVENAADILRIARELVAREKKMFPLWQRSSLADIAQLMNWESK
jgi:regulator of RNase E activity RraA